VERPEPPKKGKGASEDIKKLFGFRGERLEVQSNPQTNE
jgi:hypothetical protein